VPVIRALVLDPLAANTDGGCLQGSPQQTL